VVAVSNHGESGESTAVALGKGRFDKIWAEMKKGDYLLMQFGHNDMKAPQPNAIALAKKARRGGVPSNKRVRGVPRNQKLPFVPPEDWYEWRDACRPRAHSVCKDHRQEHALDES
jgi:lysophospholipase L1-like esterase